MALASLYLKKNEERRLRGGHLWVFSNEVDTTRSPLQGFQPGEQVVVMAANGKPLGCAYVNPNSLICARLVSRDGEQGLTQSLLVHRLKVALSLRERLFPGPYYRLVHGEADALPGLVVDRYGDVVVVQLNTAGMEALKEEVVAGIVKVLKPRAVQLRNDSGSRKPEGLEEYVETAFGELPEAVEIVENDTRFEVGLSGGQKTGWFYDQRDNRARVRRYAQGVRVLDVFSYTGGWGLAAATGGAAEVLCVDASERALDGVERNAALNGVADRVQTIQGDAFDALKALRSEGERFDVVILDPPAFIKRKKDIKEGVAAYRRINQAAMQLLGRDGFLVSASCSHHLRREVLVEQMQQAARHVDRRLQVLEHGYQAPDHPIHPAIPETDYIKAVFSRLVLD